MAQVTFNAESQFVGHLSVMYLFSHGMIVNQQGGFELENSDSIFPMKISSGIPHRFIPSRSQC